VTGNADDIVYPPSAPVVRGNVVVTVKTIVSGQTLVDPAGYRAELLYANSGAEATLTDNAPPFSFSNVPMGIHAVRVVKTTNPNAGSIVSQDTITVRPGGRRALLPNRAPPYTAPREEDAHARRDDGRLCPYCVASSKAWAI
jgi:hypothetical protein